jgi:hypothetical protein
LGGLFSGSGLSAVDEAGLVERPRRVAHARDVELLSLVVEVGVGGLFDRFVDGDVDLLLLLFVGGGARDDADRRDALRDAGLRRAREFTCEASARRLMESVRAAVARS